MPQALAYERVKIDSLKFDPRNARKHDDRNIKAIMDSLSKFGQQKAIVIGDGGVVIAGNGTLEAAKRLGWDTIDVRRSGLKADEATAYAIADNRSAELAEWDDPVLSDILGELKESGWELDDLGFNDEDLKDILKQEAVPGLTDEDEVPEVDQNEFGVKRGDIWQLGNHRLMCGDSTIKEDVEKLMNGEKADMVFFDPPYDLENIYEKIPLIENCNYLIMTQRKFIFSALKSCEKNKFDFCFDYVLYRKSPWLLSDDMPLVTHKNLFWYKNGNTFFDIKGKLRPWGDGEYKGNIEKTSCKNGEKYIQKQDPNGKRYCSVFEYEMKEEKTHPHQKPIEFMEYVILSHSRNLALDLFLGSGSTLIACEKTGRKCYGMELDEHYCSVIIKRWQDFTGKVAERIVEGA